MLRTKFRVLKTPENYNTTLSIARVVDLELDENYDFFICEKGAYHVGDIKNFFAASVELPESSVRSHPS